MALPPLADLAGNARRLAGRRRALRALALAPLALLAACRQPLRMPFNVARVGVLAPLTGDRTDEGREMAAAVRLAVEEWNGVGGVAGIHLELVEMDETWPRAAAILGADPRMLLVAGGTSALPIAELLAQPDHPAAVVLHRTASGPLPAGVVELAPSVAQVAEVAAAAIAFNFGPVTLSAVSSGSAEAVEQARAFLSFAPGRGLIIRQTLTLQAVETSYTQAALAVRQAAPQVLYVVGQGIDAGALWSELRPRDARVRLVLGPGVLDEGFYRTAGGFFEGVSAIDLTLQPEEAPGGQRFVAAFAARFGRAPGGAAARAYDAIGLGMAAMRAAITGSELPSRAAVRQALTAQERFPGVLREYRLRDGAPAGWKLAISRLERDRRRVLIGEPEIP